MGSIVQDLKYGLRVLMSAPGFTSVAVITLALGIGANTAMFTVINAVLLKPLPFPNPEQLVSLRQEITTKAGGATTTSPSYPDFFDWRSRSQSFQAMATYRNSSLTLALQGQAKHLESETVSSDFFSVLGVSPVLGRGFLRDEEKPGSHVAVISDSLWKNEFGSDPTVVGRNIRLAGAEYTVIGIMPRGFEFPFRTPAPQIWTTLAIDSMGKDSFANQRGAHLLDDTIARLKPAITAQQAQAELATVNQQLAKQYPEDTRVTGAKILPELESLAGDQRHALLLLFAAVGCVLLIACVNVANLSLARATQRSREIAVRSALGASRGRMLRQLLTESILLGLLGSALGLGLAQLALQVLLHLSPQDIPRLSSAGIDITVFAFTVVISLGTSILFGMAPALQATKLDMISALRTAGSSASRTHTRLRAALVVAETAIGLVLLLAAGLLISSFVRLLHVDSGVDPHNVLTFSLDVPDARYSSEKNTRLYEDLLTRLRQLPGVISASAALPLPLTGDHLQISFDVEGHPVPHDERPSGDVTINTPSYFQTLGIPMLQGRDFNARDDKKATPVAIVSESFARQYFPGENVIGKHIQPGISADDNPPPMREVIGVVRDVKQSSLREAERPMFYLPETQIPFGGYRVAVRASSSPELLLNRIRQEVAALDSEIPVYEVRTMDEFVSISVAQQRFQTSLLAIFGALALVLTAVGLYGVMAYTVAQKTRDIGVRIALGATRMNVLSMVMKQGLALTGAGLVIGGICAIAVTRLLMSMLFNTRPLDAVVFGAALLVLLLVAVLATYLPARRATHVDPMVALRSE